MRIAIAWFLSAALLTGTCGSSQQDGGTLDAAAPVGNECVADLSTAAASALPVVLGQKTVGMVCPRGDQDFYAVDIGEEASLLDVSVAYPSTITKVALEVKLFQLDGVSQVAGGSASDTETSDGKSAVATTFAVPAAGTYILRVGDASNANTDSVNSYVLQAATAADPDTHEPNDTVAQAKVADGAPGYLSYAGDVDYYQVTIAKPGSLLQMKVNNPLAAKAAIAYEIRDATLDLKGSGVIRPAATPTDLTRPAPATGALYVSLRYADGSVPDRRAESGYTLTLAEIAETDSNDVPPRNDSPATATCLAGTGTPCPAVYAGTAVSFKTQTGSIGSLGDRDYFVFRATTAPGVVSAVLRAPATQLDLAFDVLVPDPGSPCTADADCKVLATSCSTNDDCELSHQCVEPATGACTTTSCRHCAGAGLCLTLPDNAGKRACGVTLYSVVDSDGGMKTGADGFNTVRTAQPIFTAGPVIIVVHDNKDDQYDPALTYSLDVQAVPEPDPADNVGPTERNNFYNPYPIQTTNLKPSQKRAKDISAQITAGSSITGFISYQSDEDWFSFNHPCPGQDCGLQFEWVQPGPSSVRPVFFLRRSDLSLHESWTYAGTVPTTAPITDVFGDGDCTECSFASAKHTAPDATTPYKYYLQVRDAGADDWDFSSSGQYQFRLKTVTTGCPNSCSESPVSDRDAGVACQCFCKAKNQCPAGPAL